MLENFYHEMLMKYVWCPCVSNEMNFLSMKWIWKRVYSNVRKYSPWDS